VPAASVPVEVTISNKKFFSPLLAGSLYVRAVNSSGYAGTKLILKDD